MTDESTPIEGGLVLTVGATIAFVLFMTPIGDILFYGLWQVVDAVGGLFLEVNGVLEPTQTVVEVGAATTIEGAEIVGGCAPGGGGGLVVSGLLIDVELSDDAYSTHNTRSVAVVGDERATDSAAVPVGASRSEPLCIPRGNVTLATVTHNGSIIERAPATASEQPLTYDG